MQENDENLLLRIALGELRGPEDRPLDKEKLQLYSHYHSPEEFFGESAEAMAAKTGGNLDGISLLLQGIPQALENAKKERDYVQKHNIHTHLISDEHYPHRLRECVDAPLLFYSQGDIEWNIGHFVAIVGTRQSTQYGQHLVQELVAGLAHSLPLLTIISGLAYGIDIEAHRAALENQVPTIGVLAGGMARLYPQRHHKEAERMCAQHGGLLCEQRSDTDPLKPYFIRRNRIIAGLADAVVVAESAAVGGSLVTASIANSYNRDVFAFPSKVGDYYSAGCNQLIKQNKAAMIENAEDLLYAKGWNLNPPLSASEQEKNTIEPPVFTETEREIYLLLRKEGPLHADDLALKLAHIPSWQTILFEMECKGSIQRLPGNRYAL